MFDFFDPQKNPFLVMMNMDTDGSESSDENIAAGAGFPLWGMDMGALQGTDPMQFMKQALMIQMQLVQMMMTMPFQMVKGMSDILGGSMQYSSEENSKEASKADSFKIGDMEISPRMLQMLLKMDMSPENLGKLQKTLDFVFSMMPKEKGDEAE